MRNVLKAFIFISLGGLLVGYVIGITSNVISTGQLLCHDHPVPTDTAFFLQLQAVFSPNWVQLGTASDAVKDFGFLETAARGYNHCYDIDVWMRGFLTASSLIGATLASIYCFRYADALGRRREVQVSASLYFFGATLAASSPHLWGITAGFLIYGLGIGFAMHVGPAYLGEIAPAHIRGTLIAAKEAAIVLGILLGFLAGYAFSGIEPWGWRCMTLVAAFFALIMGFGMCWIPESPRWLELHDLPDDAVSSMQFFREDKSLQEVKEEMATIRAACESNRGASGWDAFRYPLPMLIGCGLVFLQQVTGQPSVLYFATSIFKALGFGADSAFSSVSIGVVKLLTTLLVITRVDSYGRRSLLLTGIGMMIVALITIAISMSSLTCTSSDPDGSNHLEMMNCSAEHMPRAWQITLVLSFMLYVSGYQVGFGPISWMMIAEVFPLHVRSSAISVAVLTNFGTNILVTATQPALLEAVGPSGLFSLYSILAMLSLLFVWYIVPETRGKTLEEITSELTGKAK